MMMKNFYKKICGIFILIYAFSFSQIEKEKSLLWEVSGGNLTKPSYFFGTFHIMCKGDYELGEKIDRAIQESNNFVMEIDFSNPEQMKQMQSILVGKSKISSSLTPAEKSLFQENLSQFGYQLQDIDQFSPIAIYSMLSVKLLNCEQKDLKMIDLELMQMAQKAEKKMMGLETAEEQSKVFSDFLSKKELLNFVSDFEKSKKQMAEMLQIYSKEDIHTLFNMMEKSNEMSPKQKDIFLDRRNKKWMQVIPEIMEEKSSFFAVGAGHLMGETGILNLLLKKGYTVKAVVD